MTWLEVFGGAIAAFNLAAAGFIIGRARRLVRQEAESAALLLLLRAVAVRSLVAAVMGQPVFRAWDGTLGNLRVTVRTAPLEFEAEDE